ncbi:uncharacterized protein LOC120850884 [Ixodes scapularis]|uniref:uncharacterized protein LOC120850884 n=1 Tax=Ixodes scapularis TaxID=6945 RepID=UPI001A9F40D8|nr:uncharacterized protein LOC120850884 [Ixodes scapularis]
MVLKPGSEPVIQAARRVPHLLREPLKNELERMETARIITKVDEPSDWFVPGKQLVLADALSRAPLPGSQKGAPHNDVEVHAISVLSSLVSSTTDRHPWRMEDRPVSC